MSRQPQQEVSPKQLEIYELILNSVKNFGYQPTLVELKDLVGVHQPAIRTRINYLIEKNMLRSAPKGGERCWGFVGLKFLPYRVDPVTNELLEEQEYDLGQFVVTIKRK